MEVYICRGHFIDNLKYDWLMMMSFGGAVFCFYHVIHSIKNGALFEGVRFGKILV